MSDNIIDEVTNAAQRAEMYANYIKIRDNLHALASLALRKKLCYDEAVIFMEYQTCGYAMILPPYKRLVQYVVDGVYGRLDIDNE